MRRKEDSLWWWLVVVALLLLTESLGAMGSPGLLDTFKVGQTYFFSHKLSQRFVRSRTSKQEQCLPQGLPCKGGDSSCRSGP